MDMWNCFFIMSILSGLCLKYQPMRKNREHVAMANIAIRLSSAVKQSAPIENTNTMTPSRGDT